MDQSLDQLRPAAPAAEQAPIKRSRSWFRSYLRNVTAVVGTIILLFWIGMAVIGPSIAPYGINEIDSGQVWKPPSESHIMGTDNLGRDIFSRVIIGARQMIVLPTLAVALALALGVMIGLTSGYFGGWIDEVTMRIMDGLMAFPVLMLYLMIIVASGASAVNVVIALAIGSTPAVARLTRGLVLSLRSREFILAARMRGERTTYIIFQEILPIIAWPILVDGLVRIGYVCFAMGALGFLGLGVPPPAPDWGQMVSQARNALIFTPTAPIFPALAIASLVIAFNLVADGLNEALKAE